MSALLALLPKAVAVWLMWPQVLGSNTRKGVEFWMTIALMPENMFFEFPTLVTRDWLRAVLTVGVPVGSLILGAVSALVCAALLKALEQSRKL